MISGCHNYGSRESDVSPKTKVLVVDDDYALRSLLAKELEEVSFEVRAAEDGDEAIQLVRSESEKGQGFDVILLDIKMPKVDGFEVLKYARAKIPQTKVIMVTGYAEVKNAIESFRLGASNIISKPFDLDEVVVSIERALQES